LPHTKACRLGCCHQIAPKGDLASRSLQVRLDVDRVDPENRSFRHPDPIGWTRANRGEILQALYTILLGNPALNLPRDARMKTRFKMWYRLVGAAVEYAATCVGHELDLGALFLQQEEGDEDATSLAEMLVALSAWMVARDGAFGREPQPFKAADLATAINSATPDEHALVVRGFLFADKPTAGMTVTPKSITKRLKAYQSTPARHGRRTLVLKAANDKHAEVLLFWIETKQE
jgi:hypothetical protein